MVQFVPFVLDDTIQAWCLSAFRYIPRFVDDGDNGAALQFNDDRDLLVFHLRYSGMSMLMVPFECYHRISFLGVVS